MRIDVLAESSAEEWPHGGVAVSVADGALLAATGRGLAVFDEHGDEQDLVYLPPDVNAHSVSSAVVDGDECLLIANNGPNIASHGAPAEANGSVLLMDRSGSLLTRLNSPPLSVYRERPFKPTAAVYDASRSLVWVADGYGASLLHCFSVDGYEDTLDVDVAGQKLYGPHDLLVSGAELLVADRANHRVLQLAASGEWSVPIPKGATVFPGALAMTPGGQLIVGELAGRLGLFSATGQLAERWGRLSGDPESDRAWPNSVDSDGARPPVEEPGLLHTAHSIAVTANNDVLVSQWQMGGRVLLLRTSALPW